jgi:hypothetical protein
MSLGRVGMSQLLGLATGIMVVPALAQQMPPAHDPGLAHYQCPLYPYLPTTPTSINGWELSEFWIEPEIETLTLDIPPTVEPGSIITVRFDFLVDALGCPSSHIIIESSGYEALDEAILEVLAGFAYVPAEGNAERRPVSVTGGAFGFGVLKDDTRHGNLEGVLGEVEFDLDGVYAYFKTARYSDLCDFSIVSTPMDPFAISFLAQFPCSGWNELVGREHRHGPSDYEYLRVSADFEFDESGTGGRHQTSWETTGAQGRSQRAKVRTSKASRMEGPHLGFKSMTPFDRI